MDPYYGSPRYADKPCKAEDGGRMSPIRENEKQKGRWIDTLYNVLPLVVLGLVILILVGAVVIGAFEGVNELSRQISIFKGGHPCLGPY